MYVSIVVVHCTVCHLCSIRVQEPSAWGYRWYAEMQTVYGDFGYFVRNGVSVRMSHGRSEQNSGWVTLRNKYVYYFNYTIEKVLL